MSYISYTPKSEEELLRIATQRTASSYDDQMAQYERQAEKKEAMYNESLSKLDPAYDRLGAEVERQYDLKRQNVADAAMARGFGRSSYVTDVIGQTHDQQAAALEELARKKSDEAEQIAGQIEALYDDLLANQSRLSAAKQSKILSTIDQLRLEQEAREFEAMKYNADVASRAEQLAMQREQWSAQMAYNQSQLGYNQQKAAQEADYRQQQMAWEREQFAYKQQMDALARETALRELAIKEAESAARLAKTAASAAGKSSSGGSAKAKASGTGIQFAGVRI